MKNDPIWGVSGEEKKFKKNNDLNFEEGFEFKCDKMPSLS